MLRAKVSGTLQGSSQNHKQNSEGCDSLSESVMSQVLLIPQLEKEKNKELLDALYRLFF